MHSWHLDVLEARPHGRMLNFDPITGRTTVLMGGLGFANGIALSPKRLGLLNAMILMAHNLDLRVVCEGVETAEELSLLQDLGCDWAQGYHLDRPLPVAALVQRWLRPAARVSAVA